jgi:hypothetical protein
VERSHRKKRKLREVDEMYEGMLVEPYIPLPSCTMELENYEKRDPAPGKLFAGVVTNMARTS